MEIVIDEGLDNVIQIAAEVSFAICLVLMQSTNAF